MYGQGNSNRHRRTTSIHRRSNLPPSSQAADTNTNTVGTETTPTKRKREEDHEGRTNTNTINNNAEASKLEEAATEEGGHNLNFFNDDVPLPQLQAVRRDDDDDDDEEEEEEEEIEEEEDNEGEEDSDADEDEEEDDDDDNNADEDDGSSMESVVPTPDEVELEYTYPQDFVGRRWQDVVPRGQYFRVIIDPACAGIAEAFFQGCQFLIEVIFRGNTLTRIRRRAFDDCRNLQRINAFPKTLQYLEGEAFSKLSNAQNSPRYSQELCIGW